MSDSVYWTIFILTILVGYGLGYRVGWNGAIDRMLKKDDKQSELEQKTPSWMSKFAEGIALWTISVKTKDGEHTYHIPQEKKNK